MPDNATTHKHYTLRPVVAPVPAARIGASAAATAGAAGVDAATAGAAGVDAADVGAADAAGARAPAVAAGVVAAGGRAAIPSASSDAFLRPAGEDDDGYDPYSDRPAQPDPLFQENPWG